MKGLRSSSFVALLFVATIVAPAAAAAAKAPEYLSSDPAKGEMVQQAPEKVEIIFSEPLDAASKLTVSDECGNRVDDGKPVIQANVMSIEIAKKPAGTYMVSYLAKGLSGITGEKKGKFDFMVHKGPACDGDSSGGHGNMPGMGGGSSNADGGGDSGSPHASMQGGPSMDPSGMSGMEGMEPAMPGSPMAMGSMEGPSMKGSPMDDMDMGDGGGGPGKHASMEGMGDEQEPTLAAGPGGLTVPDGQAVIMALAMSLMVGAVGGWVLRVSGAR